MCGGEYGSRSLTTSDDIVSVSTITNVSLFETHDSTVDALWTGERLLEVIGMTGDLEASKVGDKPRGINCKGPACRPICRMACVVDLGKCPEPDADTGFLLTL